MKNKNTRLLQLMEKVNWQGTNSWLKVQEKFQNEAIPGFKDWLAGNFNYITPEDVREITRAWLFEGKSDSPGSAFFIKKDRGISCLVALYLYQQEQKNGRTD